MRKSFLIFVLFYFLFSPVFCLAQQQDPLVTSYEKAVILESQEITRKITENDPEFSRGSEGIISAREVNLGILSGKFKGKKKLLEYSEFVNPANLEIRQGDKVIVYLQEFSDGNFEVQIHDYYRLPQMIFLVILFVFLIVLIGRGKGLRAAISLLISVFLIFKIFIPLALKGINPVWLALTISSIIAIVTLLIITGFKKKTLSAILGTIGGVICSVIIAIIFGNLFRLNGLSSEEARILSVSFSLNFKGLLFSGIIIAALGAVMDISMSIASGISEIKKAQPEISRRKLVKSGIAMGQDIIGTMANTLIFAYFGASLFILLLFTKFGESYLKFFNFDFFAEEALGAIAGSIGLILAVPITAFIAGYLESKS